jgi:hypothetical protein
MRRKAPPLDPRKPPHRCSSHDQEDGDDLTALAAELEREDLRVAQQGRQDPRHAPGRLESKGSKKPNWLLDILLLSTLALLVYGYANGWF